MNAINNDLKHFPFQSNIRRASETINTRKYNLRLAEIKIKAQYFNQDLH